MPLDPNVTLERALAYQNDDIPYRFMDDWDVSFEDARLLFDDVKRYLWVDYKSGWEMIFVGPLAILDDMYHCFILFTTEYTAYCNEVYGTYIHHAPITRTQREKDRVEFAVDPEAGLAKTLESRERQRRFIAEHLGLDVLSRWYVEYPVKYGDEFFRTKRKPHRTHWLPDAAALEMAARIRGDA